MLGLAVECLYKLRIWGRVDVLGLVSKVGGGVVAVVYWGRE